LKRHREGPADYISGTLQYEVFKLDDTCQDIVVDILENYEGFTDI
jgi:hypothetical protein